MKGRRLPALLLALLLPLPLLAVVFVWLMPHGPRVPEGPPEEVRLVPWIPLEEQRHLPTSLRPCLAEEDCQEPLICLRGVPLVKPYCTASECVTDRECVAGFSCRSLKVGSHVVRLCGAEGARKEGERCWKLPRRQEQGCEPGLRCAAGRCGRPCEPQAPGGCPEGFFCGAEDVEGPACLPTCEGRSCSEGQRCVGLRHGASVCARVHGEDCQREPCPAEQVCDVALSAAHEGHAWMRCARPCGPREPPCPEGFVCLAERCRQRCEPGTAGNCGSGERCVESPRHAPGLCSFDMGLE